MIETGEESPYRSPRASHPEIATVGVIATILIVVATILATVCTFCVTCFGIGLFGIQIIGPFSIIAGIIVGTIAAIKVARETAAGLTKIASPNLPAASSVNSSESTASQSVEKPHDNLS